MYVSLVGPISVAAKEKNPIVCILVPFQKRSTVGKRKNDRFECNSITHACSIALIFHFLNFVSPSLTRALLSGFP